MTYNDYGDFNSINYHWLHHGRLLMLSWIINIIIADFILGVSIFSALAQTKEDEDWKKKFKKNKKLRRTSTWLKPGTKPPLKEVVEYKKKKGLL